MNPPSANQSSLLSFHIQDDFGLFWFWKRFLDCCDSEIWSKRLALVSLSERMCRTGSSFSLCLKLCLRHQFDDIIARPLLTFLCENTKVRSNTPFWSLGSFKCLKSWSVELNFEGRRWYLRIILSDQKCHFWRKRSLDYLPPPFL
jgi:hypothetical protein